jgi:hypothetical protein
MHTFLYTVGVIAWIVFCFLVGGLIRRGMNDVE